MSNRNHLCLVLLAALALPASELNAQQAPGFVSAGCESNGGAQSSEAAANDDDPCHDVSFFGENCCSHLGPFRHTIGISMSNERQVR